MRLSNRQLRTLIGIGAIAAPTVHTLTDIAELLSGGFSAPQLWANYVAFSIVPFAVMGLYAMQRPAIGAVGLLGALLYGFSFVFFTHTTLYALAESVADYSSLWSRLGDIYTVHGLVMIIGGLAFGAASYRARVFPGWTSIMFCAGVLVNLFLTVLAVPDVLQTLGSALRNLGLVGMGAHLVFGPTAGPSAR
ncbi:MAG: hypothetical protein AAFZ58_15450 [Pseudomonadota bacterium]